MKLRFSKSISPILWALVITAGTPFCKAAWAESLPGDAPNKLMAAPEKAIANQSIEFKTLIPDRPITLPKEGTQKAIEKFGIRITNHSKTEKIFAPDFVKLSVLDENGRLMRLICGNTIVTEINQSSFRSLMPGESVEFLYPAGLGWDGRALRLGYSTADGEGCFISGLKAGKYSVSIDYDVERNASILNSIDLWHRWNIDPRSVWKEKVNSTPATLTLIESQDGQPNP
jgi:hypothetical protein